MKSMTVAGWIHYKLNRAIAPGVEVLGYEKSAEDPLYGVIGGATANLAQRRSLQPEQNYYMKAMPTVAVNGAASITGQMILQPLIEQPG